MADGGAISIPLLMSIIGTTVGVVSAVQGISAAKDAAAMRAATDEVLKVQAETAKELHDFWKNKYKKLEVALTNEMIGWEPEVVDYDKQCARIVSTSQLQFTNALTSLQSMFDEMCVPNIDKFILRRIINANNDVVNDVVNFAYRYAEHITQARNDRDFARLMQVSGLGRGLLGESLKYSSSAAATFSSLGANAQSNANNALRGAGYLMKRNSSGGGNMSSITSLLGN